METTIETAKFYERVWGCDTGKRCIASSVPGDKESLQRYMLDTNEEAVAFAAGEIEKQKNVYFGVHLFDGNGKKAENAIGSRAFYLDIDCGEGKAYKDQFEAVKAVNEMAEKSEMPLPKIVDSGNGIHCYWLLSHSITEDKWTVAARQLEAICKVQGLKVDSSVTKDRARVMRCPGSSNRKDPSDGDGKPCKILLPGTIHDPADIQAILDKIAPAIQYENASELNDPFLSGLETASDPKRVREIVDLCLPYLSIERCNDHNGWLNFGIVAYNELGDDGLPIWVEWSKQSTKYKDGECEARWQTFSDDRPDGERLKLGSFVAWAKEDGGERFRKEWERYWADKKIERLAVNGYPLSDAGNGLRFVDLFGDRVRFDPERKIWNVANEKQWIENAWADAMELSKEAARAMRAEAGKLADAGDNKAYLELAKHAVKTEAVNKYEAMLKAASTDPRIRATASDFDPKEHAHLLNVSNGVIDLRTGQLLPHDPAYMLSHCISQPYDPAARDARLEKFLNRIFADDRNLIAFVQRALGYALTGSSSEEKFFLCYGEGQNGKSSLLEAFQVLLGTIGTAIRTEVLTRHKITSASSHNEDIANLYGKRYILASESGKERRLDMELIKRLCGGDTISASKKYGHTFSFEQVGTLFIMANDLPEIRETDFGTKRRLVQVPFTVQIPDDERDDSLKAYLKTDPGAQQAILAWAVQGAVEWYRRGLGTCDAVQSATERFLHEQDIMARYVAECCKVGKGPEFKITPIELIEDVKSFCESCGIDPPNAHELPAEMRRLKFEQSKIRGERYWIGLRKKSDGENYSERVSA